ncbi:MAG: conjugal transfer protein TraX [Oscillospiraceae bacterium]|nr:conjugal transfer protein TraX [Oscillospiraceae bacterium]
MGENSTSLAAPVGGKKLGSDVIKYIAAAAMLIDHIAWCFVDTYSVLGQTMHIIGRMTAPIMCYFIAEGYHYTSNVKKYMLRLGIFALLSWIPFVYMETGQLPFGITDGKPWVLPMQGVIYTFFLGLWALIIVHNEKIPPLIRGFMVFMLCAISIIGDWPVFAVVWILLFDRFRGDLKKQAIAFAVSSIVMIFLIFDVMMNQAVTEYLFQFSVLLALVPLYFYSGEKGRGGRFNKWFFYVFYPLHMLILGILKFNIL